MTQGFDKAQREMRMRRLLDRLPGEYRAASAVLADMAADLEFCPSLVGDGSGYDYASEKASFAEGIVWALSMGASLKEGVSNVEGLTRLAHEKKLLMEKIAERDAALDEIERLATNPQYANFAIVDIKQKCQEARK